MDPKLVSAHSGRASARVDAETTRLESRIEELAVDTEIFGGALPERLELDLGERPGPSDDDRLAALRSALGSGVSVDPVSLEELWAARHALDHDIRAAHAGVREPVRDLGARAAALADEDAAARRRFG